jgi:hypothetical protein
MTFEEWMYIDEDFDTTADLSRAAWNAAIEEAAKVCERFGDTFELEFDIGGRFAEEVRALKQIPGAD